MVSLRPQRYTRTCRECQQPFETYAPNALRCPPCRKIVKLRQIENARQQRQLQTKKGRVLQTDATRPS